MQALTGLHDAIVSCETSSKILQNDADILFEKLSQRKFPPSTIEIANARRQIRDELVNNVDNQIDDDIVYDEKMVCFFCKLYFLNVFIVEST